MAQYSTCRFHSHSTHCARDGKDYWMVHADNFDDLSLPQTLWFRFTEPKRIVKYAFGSYRHNPHRYGVSNYTFFGANGDCLRRDSGRLKDRTNIIKGPTSSGANE